MERLHLAPAKLTLSLHIVGIRSDGMHLIEAEMVTVSLADEIRIDPEPGEDGSTSFALEFERQAFGSRGGLGMTRKVASGTEAARVAAVGDAALPEGAVPDATAPDATAPDATAPDATAPEGAVPEGAANLVLRALELADRHPSRVRLLKRIPAGAGLGGGSSDAAAILRWAGWTDMEAAATIGADVPFCLVGGRAIVTGIGEVVEPLSFVPMTFTIITPEVHCSTPRVYEEWDALGGPTSDSGNDLEAAALSAYPELARWRDRLGEMTGLSPRLAGSGATWFVEGAFPEAGLVVETVPAGWEGGTTYLQRDAGTASA